MTSISRHGMGAVAWLAMASALLWLACGQVPQGGDEVPQSEGMESQALLSEGWLITGSMHERRMEHTATLLPDGKVLVVGGTNKTEKSGGTTVYNSTEVYDPGTGQWSLTGNLNVARHAHTATLLLDGKVLVAGGADNDGNPLESTEVYDPGTGQWSLTGNLNVARRAHTATLLLDGRVLVVGGTNSKYSTSSDYVSALNSAELYDPVSNSWTHVDALMKKPRTDHTATRLQNGKVVVIGGRNTTEELDSAEVFDPTSKTWEVKGGLILASFNHSATLLPDGKVLVVGGQFKSPLDPGCHDSRHRSELYDAEDGVARYAHDMGEERTQHTATLLPSSKVLIAGGAYMNVIKRLDNSKETTECLVKPFYLAEISDGGIYSDAGMERADYINTPRTKHTTTLLPNGKVLVTGGRFQNAVYNSAELYDPGAGQWSPTQEPPFKNRLQHTATLLPNGKVLIAGGQNTSRAPLQSVAEYNPYADAGTDAGQWAERGSLNHARHSHTATLLPNGKVLIAGGQGTSGVPLQNVAEYNTDADVDAGVDAGQWAERGSLNHARYSHTATLLPGGKVLVAGGQGTSSDGGVIALASTEVYDPGTGQWAVSGLLNHARYAHTATQLPGGKVLVAGGLDTSGNSLNQVEIYDPSTLQWTRVDQPLRQARYDHSATLLPDGKVLVVGGRDISGAPLTSAEVYDPEWRQWVSTGALKQARFQHTTTLLLSGKVLVAGGQGDSATMLPSEVYDPGTGRWSATHSLNEARTHHTATLLTSGQVLVTGGGDVGVEIYEDTGAQQQWRPVIKPLDTRSRGDELIISGSGLRGLSEASSGTNQNSATNFPLVSLMSVEGGALTRLKIEGSISNTTLTLQMPDLPNGYYILSVMTNAIHGGQLMQVKGPPLAAPVVTAPGIFVNVSRPSISGTAEAGRRITVWLDETVIGTTMADEEGAWSFTPATSLAEGIRRAKATATDAMGIVSPFSGEHSFTVDTVHPVAPVVTVPGNSVNTTTPTMGGTAEPGSTVTVWLDGAAVGTIVTHEGNWSLTSDRVLDPGPHEVSVTAVDAAGNLSAHSAIHRFEIDLTPPVAPMVTEPDRLITGLNPVIAGTAEPGSTVRVWLDGAEAGETPATKDGKWFFRPDNVLNEGRHVVLATTMDAAGNLSASSVPISFELDSTAPERPNVTEPRFGTSINDPQPTIRGTAEAEIVVTVTLNGKTVSTVTDKMGNWSFTLDTPLGHGSYSVKALAWDAAGNDSAPSALHIFEVDLIPPEAPKVSGPGAVVTTHQPIISGIAERDSAVNVWVDGKRAETVRSNGNGDWSYVPANGLAGGSHNVFATATDEAGNTSQTSAMHPFFIQRSHYGWSCSSAPDFPASWALLTLALALHRRRLRSP
ncbi:putative delta-60 repeat protein [Archangium gephyra]|uniref:Branched-chain amino acid ABC transporter, amino acid-binding protein n=1 Tax=Archangium gephyra TaxID=48 RepID=A0AAC8QDA4_9BACT|nr:kelch repeat-containing protein [Archangium gephyra]AKJ05108.1 Branched-chain amino acid ABC transporter, amino acid-binding protein [Archangium gephyra]REG35806.1 putative delta-60 repeat protein [Archangium gephyra]